MFGSDGNEDGGAAPGQHEDCPLSSGHHGRALPATSGQRPAPLCSHTQTMKLVFESLEKRNEKNACRRGPKSLENTTQNTALLCSFPFPPSPLLTLALRGVAKGTRSLARSVLTSASPLMQHRDCTDWLMCSLDVAIGFQSHYLNFQQHPHSFHEAFGCSEKLKSLISNALDGNQEQRERHNRSSSVSSSVIMESLHTVYALLHF